MSAAALYTFIWNLIGNPAGTIPIRFTKPGETSFGYDQNGGDGDNKACRRAMEGSEGMPLTVQVIGLPFQDEKLVGIMKLIEGLDSFGKEYLPLAHPNLPEFAGKPRFLTSPLDKLSMLEEQESTQVSTILTKSILSIHKDVVEKSTD